VCGAFIKARAITIYRRRNHTTIHRLVFWRVTETSARNGVGVKDAAKMVCPGGTPDEVQFRNTLTPPMPAPCGRVRHFYKGARASDIRRRNYKTIHRLVIWRVTEKNDAQWRRRRRRCREERWWKARGTSLFSLKKAAVYWHHLRRRQAAMRGVFLR
jgi:hypothetical protein